MTSPADSAEAQQEPKLLLRVCSLLLSASQRCLKRWLGFAVVWLAAASCAGCAGDNPTPQNVVPDASLATIVQQAELIDSLLRPVVNSNAELNSYLKAICDRLRHAAGESDRYRGRIEPIECDVVPGDTPAAFTTGGGHAYVSVGLLHLCKSENELAAVLAHEYAHLLDAHEAARPVSNPTNARALALAFAEPPFSAAQELEADRDGFDVYARAGWDPTEYGRIFDAARTAFDEFGPKDAVRLASQLPRTADDWRQPPVANDRAFLALCRETTFSGSPEVSAILIIRSFQRCFGPNQAADREAAVSELKEMIAPKIVPRPNVPQGEGAVH